MPNNGTISGKTGVGGSLSSLMISDISLVDIQRRRGVIYIEHGSGQKLDVDFSQTSVITITVANGNISLVVS